MKATNNLGDLSASSAAVAAAGGEENKFKEMEKPIDREKVKTVIYRTGALQAGVSWLDFRNGYLSFCLRSFCNTYRVIYRDGHPGMGSGISSWTCRKVFLYRTIPDRFQIRSRVRGLGDPVVIGYWPLVQRVRGSIPDRSTRSEINLSGLYVRRGWFTGIELVLDSTTDNKKKLVLKMKICNLIFLSP